MKKRGLMGLLAAGLLVGLLLPAGVPVLADVDYEGEAETYPLLAGQDTEVGSVKVWNDEEWLYIQYETTDGWEMTETHLEVGCSLDDFPLNRKGNPQVGRFSEGEELAEPTTLWPEQPLKLLLEDFDCGELLIAAHAAVQKCEGEVETVSLVSDAGNEWVEVYEEGDAGQPASSYSSAGLSVLAWVHPNWQGIDGAEWVSSSFYAEFDDDVNSWRLFSRAISLPSNACNIGGEIAVNSDNAEEVVLNEISVGTDGEVYGPFTDDHEWATVQVYDVGSVLQPGANELEIMVRNYAGTTAGDSPEVNPTALTYKLDYEYQLLTFETAWADGTRFVEQGNWATYFEYCVKDWVEVETVEISSEGPGPVSSSALVDGDHYLFVASGTFDYNTAGDWADAEWYLKNGVIVKGDTEGSVPYVLDISIDDATVNRDWGAYSEDHIYTMEWIGTGDPVQFSIYDSNYSDNTGSLSVTILHWTCLV